MSQIKNGDRKLIVEIRIGTTNSKNTRKCVSYEGSVQWAIKSKVHPWI